MEERSPWTTAKTDLAATGRSLNTALQAINALKLMWAPVLPFTSQKLHELLGEEGMLFGRQIVNEYAESSRSHLALTYDATGAVGSWTREPIPAGRQLPKPKPLFKKLDASVAEEEIGRLGK